MCVRASYMEMTRGTNLMQQIIYYIYRTNVIQPGSMFINNCNNTLHVSDAFCVRPQVHLKTVVAASGE